MPYIHRPAKYTAPTCCRNRRLLNMLLHRIQVHACCNSYCICTIWRFGQMHAFHAGSHLEHRQQDEQRLSPALQALSKLNRDRSSAWLSDITRMRSRGASPKQPGRQKAAPAQPASQQVDMRWEGPLCGEEAF